MNKTVQIPLFTRAAITPNSYDATNRTIEIVFATESEVKRRTWDGTNYIEILECGPKNVRLERANSGANLVDTHNTWSISSILGVTERAWIENKQGKALIRLSERDEVKGYVQDIVSGVIRNISVGYNIYETEINENTDTNTIMVRVTDWEPGEFSLVPVPADYKSGTRSENPQNDFKYHEVKFENKRTMTTEEIEAAAQGAAQRSAVTPTPSPAPAPVAQSAPTASAEDDAAVRALGATAERQRVKSINTAVRAAQIDDQEFLDDLIERGVTVDAAREAIINKLAESQTPAIRQQARVNGNDEGDQVRSGLSEVLLHRHDPSNPLTTDKAKQYRNASLTDMAGIMLNERGHSADFTMNKNELVKRAMSTSDFPVLLGSVVNRSLRQYYEAVQSNWKLISRRRDASDFRALTSVNAGGNFELEEIKEGGEYKNVVLKEEADSFALKTFGKKISITRQAIINDDLGAFMRLTELFGRGAAQTQSKIVWGLFTANSGSGRTLGSDGKTLFHTDHNNLDAGSAMSLAAFNAARTKMVRQTGIDKDPIHVDAKYLFVPPELRTTALQLINSTIVATKTTDTNPFQNAFEVVEEIYLTDPKAWYIFADPASTPVVEYAYLNGQEGLYTEQEINFDTDSLDIKVRNDFNASIFEYRGVYKNPGQ
nr:prohead protease/major capsid protein fusion protein [Pedobacter sp. ASV19]